MNQSNDELNKFYPQALKWTCRSLFLLLATLMTYVVTRESYNFSHWVPHSLLRGLEIPYQAILWGERNADVFLHFTGGLVLTLLIYGSRLTLIDNRPARVFILISILCISAEIFQFTIGRGMQWGDLLLGILGSFMAYLAINKKN